MIPRDLEKELKKLVKDYPVIALTGPRQSGKTTLIREIFGEKYKYVNLEDISAREYALSDPKAFLEEYQDYVIIDEAQLAPDLFSYIQVMVDEHDKPGEFILTGSQNILLHEKISQSLAGRVAIFNLLPLSVKELKNSQYELEPLEEMLFKGFYPRIYRKNLDPSKWYENYIRTYIERDVRMMKNIHDLSTFQKFLKMCASRTGQLLDLTSIGNDCGISHNTVKSWINILEVSFIVFLVTPFYKNFNKRLVKSPKLYFYDTGLLCHLLNIDSPEQLSTHYLKGGIFESFVMCELMKNRLNQNKSPNLYFYRDKQGHEVDCIIENSRGHLPIEIKSSKTLSSDFFKGLNYWNKLTDNNPEHSFLVYGGELNQKRSQGKVISYQNIETIVS